jgi:hypothetical protein
MSAHAMSWRNVLRLSQWEKIVLTLALACLLPLGLHALPLSSAAGVGQTWLPIFYAPLIAALCFRSHVPLVAALCAPSINNFIFGMPADRLVLPLTFDLVVFSAIVVLLRRRSQPTGWAVAAGYTLALLLTRLIFTGGASGDITEAFLRSMATAMPGILVLVVLTEIVRYFNKRQGV